MKRLSAVVILALLISGCSLVSGGNSAPDNGVAAMTKCLTDAADSVSTGASGNTNTTVTPSAGFPADAKIGIALPEKTSQNWVEAEGMFNTALTAKGYTSIVKFATGGVTDQQNQISDMIEQGVSVLVVGAIDGSQLGAQLDAAKAAGITVIAYDRLLTNTNSIDLYIAFDNYKVGQLQGQAVIQGMLATQGPPPYNIELIAGSPDDSNSKFFFGGAMSVLQPGIDCGALVVRSGQTTQDQVASQGWKASLVQQRFSTILSQYYQDAPLNGILSPNDMLARSAIATLGNYGMSSQNTVVSGQDSETASIPLIMTGKQYMTIYKNTQAIVDEVVKVVSLLQQGQPVPINDTSSYNNGVKMVPSDLLSPEAVTAANAAEVYANDAVRIGCTQDPPVNCEK